MLNARYMVNASSKINKNKFNGVIFTPYIRTNIFGTKNA